jgi:hypothetical protein
MRASLLFMRASLLGENEGIFNIAHAPLSDETRFGYMPNEQKVISANIAI